MCGNKAATSGKRKWLIRKTIRTNPRNLNCHGVQGFTPGLPMPERSEELHRAKGSNAEWENWTRMQRIRTISDIEFTFNTSVENTFIYQLISTEAKLLHQLGFSYSKIAKCLGVTDKTSKKAVLYKGE